MFLFVFIIICFYYFFFKNNNIIICSFYYFTRPAGQPWVIDIMIWQRCVDYSWLALLGCNAANGSGFNQIFCSLYHYEIIKLTPPPMLSSTSLWLSWPDLEVRSRQGRREGEHRRRLPGLRGACWRLTAPDHVDDNDDDDDDDDDDQGWMWNSSKHLKRVLRMWFIFCCR